MNILEKRLTQVSEKSNKESINVVQEAKLLLADNAKEERDTLMSIGLGRDIIYAEDKNQDLLIRSQAKDHLGKAILHKKEIKKFCTDYRLYMKRATEYVGPIPPDLGAELSRFCKEKKIALPAHSDYSNFYIIAPPIMFAGYRTPLEVFLDADQKVRDERRLRLEQDPILVYRLNNDLIKGEYFAIVKSWGNDFSWLRRIYGAFTKKSSMTMITLLANALIAFGILKLNIFAWTTANKAYVDGKLHHNDASGWYALTVFVSVFSIAFFLIWIISDDFMRFRDNIRKTVTWHEDRFDNL